MNCLGIRCTNVKYHAWIKEPYKIEIALEQFNHSDDFIPEVLINGLSISCEIQKRANTLYFFSFWVNYSDVYKVQANENTKLLAWEEHRNFDNNNEETKELDDNHKELNELDELDELQNIYYCSSTEENYKVLIDKNFKDINDCFKKLTDKYHIRFDLEQKILFW